MRSRRWLVVWSVVGMCAAELSAPRKSEAQAAMAADTTALVDARRIVADIDARLSQLRVEAREVSGSARENARVTGFIEGPSVRRIDVVYTGITVHGFESFWFRNDSLVQATRIIERLEDGPQQRIAIRVEHQLLFRGDSVLRTTSRVTTGSGDAGGAPTGSELRVRAAGFRRCVTAVADDERACRGF